VGGRTKAPAHYYKTTENEMNKIMKRATSKSTFIWSVLFMLAIGMSGCGGTDTSSSGLPGTGGSSSSTGSNVTVLDVSALPTSFTITETAGLVGSTEKFYYAGYIVSNTSQNNVLSYGTGYTGTVATTCTFNSVSVNGLSNQYDCVTTYNINAPFAVPTATTTLRINKGEIYQVTQKENQLTANSISTLVGTILVN